MFLAVTQRKTSLFLFFLVLFFCRLNAQDKIVTALYSDSLGRFTIVAPKTWKLMPDMPIYKKRLWLYKCLSDSGNYAILKVLGGYFDGRKENVSLDSLLPLLKKQGFEIKEKGTEKLGPYTAYWVMGRDYQDVWQYMYTIFIGKKMYMVSAGGYETYFNSHKEEFRAMLKTFKPKK